MDENDFLLAELNKLSSESYALSQTNYINRWTKLLQTKK